MKFLVTLLLVFTLGGAVPVAAQQPAPSLPEQSFEQFWQAFRDHYAFFPQKHVDWDATYRTFRPRVTPQTTEPELVALLSQMAEPLHDGHVTIARGETVLFKGESARNSFKQTFKAVQPEFWRVAYQQLAAAGFAPVRALGPDFKGKRLLYVSRAGSVGYLHLSRCFADLSGVLGTEAQEQQDHRKLDKLFSKALQQLTDCQTLLLDLRDNGGGHSGYELAGYFTARRYLANYKATRQPGGYAQFGPEQAFYVTPAPKPQFTGRLLLLTSDQTASAAEDFTLALSRRPGTVLVGTSTKGMLSDMYSVQLANGLTVTLSNQRYTTPEGQPLEDVGVAPTEPVENTLPDLERHHDAVLARALELARQPAAP